MNRRSFLQIPFFGVFFGFLPKSVLTKGRLLEVHDQLQRDEEINNQKLWDYVKENEGLPETLGTGWDGESHEMGWCWKGGAFRRGGYTFIGECRCNCAEQWLREECITCEFLEKGDLGECVCEGQCGKPQQGMEEMGFTRQEHGMLGSFGDY
jgi:hypothetical protein